MNWLMFWNESESRVYDKTKMKFSVGWCTSRAGLGTGRAECAVSGFSAGWVQGFQHGPCSGARAAVWRLCFYYGSEKWFLHGPCRGTLAVQGF